MEQSKDNMSLDDRIKSLLRKYGVYQELVIDGDEERELILMALSEPDVESVVIDKEGALEIIYSGDEWSNNEQRTI
jgi:hypothetical protein